MRSFLCVLLLTLICTPFLRADDVVLKSGKVIKNLTLLKETATSYRFRTLAGKVITINKSQVVRLEKKPTARDEYKTRLSEVGDNAAKLFELAKWAKGEGLEKEWPATLKLVIKADSDHAEARELLGYKKHEGKWLDEKAYEKATRKAREAEYKAKGWKKHKGEWYSPKDYARVKRGLIRHDKYWVTKKQKRLIDTKGYIWFEGEWVSPKWMEHFKSGKRRFKGRWMSIAKLNKFHEDMEDPWIIKDYLVEIHTNVQHKTALETLETIKEVCKGGAKLMGEQIDPFDERGRLTVVMARDIEQYNALGQGARSDWAAGMSSNFGAFYLKGFDDDRGAGISCFFAQDWGRWWSAQAAAFAFIGRFGDGEKMNEKVYAGLTSYLACMHGGRFSPRWWLYRNADSLSSASLRGMDPKKLVLATKYAAGGTKETPSRTGLLRSAFVMHFLQQRAPEKFQSYMQNFIRKGEGTVAELFNTCGATDGKYDQKALAAEFAKFTEEYQKSFRPWDA